MSTSAPTRANLVDEKKVDVPPAISLGELFGNPLNYGAIFLFFCLFFLSSLFISWLIKLIFGKPLFSLVFFIVSWVLTIMNFASLDRMPKQITQTFDDGTVSEIPVELSKIGIAGSMNWEFANLLSSTLLIVMLLGEVTKKYEANARRANNSRNRNANY
jgi:hypothetical protein